MSGELNNMARILIADDELEIRELLCEVLSESYECRTVPSAEDALALLRTEKFDLVLSDITMGAMTGLEMVPHALQLAPDTVVVMISGEQTIQSAIEALRAGAFDYITKPFDLRHVEAAIRRALEHHALLAAKRRYENYLENLLKQRTAELDRVSYHDTLTGLPNRILFDDRLTQALSSGQPFLAVMFLDLDRFKKINDTLGYGVGDDLLCGVAERLKGCLADCDTVARAGSDEFTLLVTQLSSPKDAVELAYRIHGALKPAFTFGNHELYITTSIGISLHPYDGKDSQTLLKNAGAALRRAKEQGGNGYQLYTANMNSAAVRQLAMESSLRRALEREEFVIYYQPQVNINTGWVVGMEALVRWQHPEMGLVSPAEFIPLAEDTGLIVPIGEWVLRTACAQNRRWQEVGTTPLRVSVNLSPHQFRQPDLVEMVERVLAQTGLDPRHLELELTESSVMRNAERAIRILHELKEVGIQISIDDFGTGYSSLGYLKQFPIDVLKIDKSFVNDITADSHDAAIVRAIITLAHSLKLKVVAEGVETEGQLRCLRQLSCDAMQGYLYSKPLPPEAFQQLLRERPCLVSETGSSLSHA